MTRRGLPERHIKHTSIHIGDLIRVHYKVGDMDCSRVGVVRKRFMNGGSTEYMTGQAITLFTVHRDGTTDIGVKRITWLQSDVPTTNTQPEDSATLFDLE